MIRIFVFFFFDPVGVNCAAMAITRACYPSLSACHPSLSACHPSLSTARWTAQAKLPPTRPMTSLTHDDVFVLIVAKSTTNQVGGIWGKISSLFLLRYRISYSSWHCFKLMPALFNTPWNQLPLKISLKYSSFAHKRIMSDNKLTWEYNDSILFTNQRFTVNSSNAAKDQHRLRMKEGMK